MESDGRHPLYIDGPKYKSLALAYPVGDASRQVMLNHTLQDSASTLKTKARAILRVMKHTHKNQLTIVIVTDTLSLLKAIR